MQKGAPYVGNLKPKEVNYKRPRHIALSCASSLSFTLAYTLLRVL